MCVHFPKSRCQSRANVGVSWWFFVVVAGAMRCVPGAASGCVAQATGPVAGAVQCAVYRAVWTRYCFAAVFGCDTVHVQEADQHK